MDNKNNLNDNKEMDEIEIPEFSEDELVKIKPKKKNKKSIKFIGFLTGCLVLTGLSVTSTVLSICGSKEEQIKPYEQIMSDADYLDADLTLMEKKTRDATQGDSAYDKSFIRLKNNRNNPIYVYIEDMDKNLKSDIKETLDETQKLFSYINDSYRFKIVSKEIYKAASFFNYSSIRFSVEKLESGVGGENNSSLKLRNQEKNSNPEEYEKLYIVHSHIKINSEFLENNPSKEEIKNVLFHEMLHSFGFPDLYDNEYKERLCYMNVTNKFHLLHPNDIKMLYCTYGNKHINEKGNVDYNKLQQIKESIEKYEKYYYEKVFNDFFKQSNLCFKPIKLTEQFSTNFKLIQNQSFSEKIVYEIKGDKYIISILNRKSEVIEEIIGDVLRSDNYVVLKDVVSTKSSYYRLRVQKIKTSVYCILDEEQNCHIIDVGLLRSNSVTYQKKQEEEKNF